MELKTTNLYVPTDVEIELPKEIGVYLVQKYNGWKGCDTFFSNNRFGIDSEEIKTTHWLKEQNGFFLTKEELESVIGDAFDAARERVHHPDYDYVIEDKEQYIKQILP